MKDIMRFLILGIILFGGWAIIQSCTKETPEEKVEVVENSDGNKVLSARNNSNSNSAPPDSGRWVPIAYGAIMKVRLKDTIPDPHCPYYVTVLRREAGIVCPPRGFQYGRSDVHGVDSTGWRLSDSVAICRWVRI